MVNEPEKLPLTTVCSVRVFSFLCVIVIALSFCRPADAGADQREAGLRLGAEMVLVFPFMEGFSVLMPDLPAVPRGPLSDMRVSFPGIRIRMPPSQGRPAGGGTAPRS
jgi:hypothetical protein